MSSKQLHVSLVFTLLAFVSIVHPVALYAQGAGQFEGAVWSIELKPKAPSGNESGLRGRYRVNNHVIYQCETISDPNFTMAVGKNHPNGNRTRAEFQTLRMFNASREVVMMRGTVGLKMERFGEWSGLLIDSNGKHWECRVKRIQE